MSFCLTSSSFKNQQELPPKYTCDGENVSPSLRWEGAPHETKSFVLIVDDPDAPNQTWTHWVVYNIPHSVTECAEGKAPTGSLEGKNDFGKIGYGGPCPPSGTHRYFFKLYALTEALALVPGATKSEVEEAMKPYILKETEIIGTYKRR